jgi:hypothetical protein
MFISRIGAGLSALLTIGLAGQMASAQQPTVSVSPGQAVQGLVHREGDERYRLTFGTSGPALVEVSGAPADCAFQVGSQGFAESDSSPTDWTDGQPGRAVRHTFRVQAGRPGTVWVRLSSRVSGVSVGEWSGVECSASGPYYTAPDRSGSSGAAPRSFEGHAIQPPISFRLVAQTEGGASSGPGSPRDDRPAAGSSDDAIAAEYRSLLPAVLQKEKKPWHTRFDIVANTVKTGAGYRVAYKTYCKIENGPDVGKDYVCYEFDSVLDVSALKTAVADMKRRMER